LLCGFEEIIKKYVSENFDWYLYQCEEFIKELKKKEIKLYEEIEKLTREQKREMFKKVMMITIYGARKITLISEIEKVIKELKNVTWENKRILKKEYLIKQYII